MSKKSVAIIGGGVAGIATALPLADAGFGVTLYEKRPLLGGRASSYIDPQTGERLDECQHGTMRCCTYLTDLLEKLGVQDQIDYHDVLAFLDSEGNYSEIKGCGLPAPLHTSLSFLAFKSLGLRDKIGIANAMIAMLRAGKRPEHHQETIAAWFQRHGQTPRAIQRFWRPILISACNEELERTACAYAFKIFVEGFLCHPRAFHFGVPKVPLGSLYTEPTLAYLEKRESRAFTRTIVDSVEVEGNHIASITLQNGAVVTADYYVSALQFDLLLKILPAHLTEGVPYFENLKKMELSPLAGVHIWFDRPIECPPALALLDRETEWIFNKTKTWSLPQGAGTYLSMVISASHRFAKTPKEELLRIVLADVRAALPTAREANVVRSQVVRWPKGTLVPAPGVDALRPSQRSPVPNLFVAGEWTDTGWPSTMESAVRSGYRAAEYLLKEAGLARSLTVQELPIAGLARGLLRR
ncbi:MAG: hydroxysqualene dehydroxylase HpnE [Armatimonadetes bacterium]|nr:hydroxysqualene dehydroxylase HpnE [Armatimonadota bacterium]